MRFFKKPRYFDFARHRKPAVILHDLISALIGAIEAAIVYFIPSAYGLVGTYYAAVGLAYGLMAGLSYGLTALTNSLTTKSGKHNSASTGGILSNTCSTIDPIKIVYGKTRIGCSRAFVHTMGTANKIMWLVVIWCKGPVQGIATDGAGPMIWFGEKRMYEFETYLGLHWLDHYFHDGSMTQTVDANLQAEFGSWLDAMRGYAYSIFRMKYNASLYTSMPEITCVMEGRNNIYDPRDGSHAYSRNGALIARDFMTEPYDAGGIKGSLIDKQSIIDSANWCDSNGYYFDGAVCDRQEFLDNMEDVCPNFRGEWIWSGGTYKLLIQTYSTPVLPPIDERDIEQNENNALGISTSGIQDSPKRIKVTFCDPIDNYIPKHCYWPQDPTVETDPDTKEIVLTGTADFEQALKIAKYFYLRTTYSKSFDLIVHPRLIPAEICDMIEISHNTNFPVQSIPEDWADEILRISNIGITQDNKIAIGLIEEAEEIYDDTVDVANHVAYTSTLPTAADECPTPTNLEATTGEDEKTARAVDAYLELSCDNMANGLDYEFRYRKDTESRWHTENVRDPEDATEWEDSHNYREGDYVYPTTINGYYYEATDDQGSSGSSEPAWPTTPGNTVVDGGITWTCRSVTRIFARIGNLPLNQVYYWQVRSSGKKVSSDWATPASPVTTWNLDSPDGSMIVITLTQRFNAIILRVTQSIPDPSINSYLIYRNTADDSGTATQIGELSARSNKFKDNEVTPGQTYYYWVKTKDKADQISGFSGVASIIYKPQASQFTFNQVDAGDIGAEDGSIGFAGIVETLHNCDDVTSWTHSSSIAGSIVLSSEKDQIAEGTGSLKIELYRYAKKRYFDEATGAANFGRTSDTEVFCQGFKPASGFDCKAFGIKIYKNGSGQPDITVSIYSNSGGAPGSLLGTATLLSSNVPATLGSPPKDFTYAVFSSAITLSASTLYWLVLSVPSHSLTNYYKVLGYFKAFGAVNQFGDSSEIFQSGATIGSLTSYSNWDMNFRACEEGDALNKYIYVPISSQDISLKTYLRAWLKSTRSVTTPFLQFSFGESAIGEQNLNMEDTLDSTWRWKSADISGISGTSRDGVTYIGFKITNMDDDAILYADYYIANQGDPELVIRQGGDLISLGQVNPSINARFYEDFFEGTSTTDTDFEAGSSNWERVAGSFTAYAGDNGVSRLNLAGHFILRNSLVILPFKTSKNPTFICSAAQLGTGNSTRRWGLTDGGLSSDPSNGIFWRQINDGGNFIAVSRSGGSESYLDTGIAAADGVFHNLKMEISTFINVYVDDVFRGTITTNLPSVGLGLGIYSSNSTAGTGLLFDYFDILQDR